MAIQKEIWVNYIMGRLLADNAFLAFCHNDDEYVLAGKVVHIPQLGSKPVVTKNRSSLPATVVKRTDTDVTYNLDEYTTEPVLIPNADTVELSYDKVSSVIGDHVLSIAEAVANEILVKWAASASGNIVRTTGATTGSGAAARKIVKLAELQKAKLIMDKANVPSSDRYAILPADFHDQLLSDSEVRSLLTMGQAVAVPEGVIGRLFGFNILQRSATVLYDNTGTPVVKAVDAAAADDDNLAAICWQKESVARALGTVDFFEQLNAPQYYGDIYSALVRMGGRKRYSGGDGVVSIVQTVVS